MKILVIALSGIGDALLFTPALKLLKQAKPDAEIDALVMFNGAKDIYERDPAINQVIHFDFLKKGAAASFRFVTSLKGNYDATINVYPSNRKEYNIISFLIGAKKRASVRYLRKDIQNLGRLNNIRITEDDTQHNVETNIKLVEKLLGVSFKEKPDLQFYLNEKDKSFAEDYLSKLNIKSDQFVIGFHPGSAVFKNHIKRRWEPEKFSELAKKLIENHNAKVLIFGGPDEAELKKEITDKINSSGVISVSTPDLSSSAAVMKRCNVFVSNDSSLMHVASAMKINVVAIIGPTNPAYIHPWNTNHNIVTLNLDCAPCFIYSPRPLICFRDDVKFKCIKELTVDMVYSAVKSFM